MKKIKNWIKGIVFFTPFFLGTAAYLRAGSSLSWSAYRAVLLYFGEIEQNDEVLLQVAMWSALAVSAALLANAVNVLFGGLYNRIKALFPKSCVIYGNSAYAERLSGNLKFRAIRSDKMLQNASRHILLFDSDEENIRFLNEHYNVLSGKTVAVKLNKLLPYSLKSQNIITFNVAEITARLYWKKYYSIQNERIALIGFDSLGQELLSFGLTLNLFSKNQCIEYHIWGNSAEFRGIHSELTKIEGDKIIFHDGNFLTDLSVMLEFDRIILASDLSENIINLNMLTSYTCCRNIHISAPVKEIAEMFNVNLAAEKYGKYNIEVFGTTEELDVEEYIFKDVLNGNASLLHNRYETDFPQWGAWENLSGFLKRSNISSADLATVVRRLYDLGIAENELAEIEHIRWCRFHWLNNWSYAEQRDNKNRKHNLLVSYADLSEDDKAKDLNNVKIYLSILN
jgi:hypothetical protein